MVPEADIVHTSSVTTPDLGAGTTRTHSLGRLRKAAVFLLIFCALAAILGVTAWGFYRFWPRKLVIRTRSATPIPTWQGERLRLISPTGYLLSEVGRYGDELTAYLYFEYLRSLKAVDSSKVLLTTSELPSGTVYRVYLALDSDLLTTIPYLADLQARRLVSSFEVTDANAYRLKYAQAQTRLFVAAYDQPMRRKLRSLPRPELRSNLARFILFKSKTDRRIRLQIKPVPPHLSQAEARDLAADILAVADFYDLPLDFFLGIGAMENNYMDVRGDLEHSVWKRHAQPGDLVIRRRGNRVLVRNYSIGVWQITRETLRYAHSLYLRDKRDYSKLPGRLRPPQDLNFDNVNPHVLTTYAGLLFRQLLDQFDGNVQEAVGAYNGGAGSPNVQYAAGVQLVANYARRVLTQAAYVNGRAIADAKLVFAVPRRKPSPES